MKPKNTEEALEMMKAGPATKEEAAEAFGDDEDDAAQEPVNGIPDWVIIPQGFKMPTGGRTVSFIKFRAEWTDTPGKGDRQCIIWNLNGADEKLAIARSRGDHMRLMAELTKQMVRAVDGHKVNWSGKGGPGNVDLWYDAIGAKCRQIIQNHYVKTHALTEEERTDFFENCIAVRTAG